jgi:anti-anti-sigma regulatory factor
VLSQLLIAFPARHGHLRVADVLDGPGRADLGHRLDDALAAGCTRLVVDCSQVQHVDERTVSDLAAASVEMSARGGALVVRAPTWAFTRVVERCGRNDLLDMARAPEPTTGEPRSPVEPVDLRDRLAEHASRRGPRVARHRRPGVLVEVGRPRD